MQRSSEFEADKIRNSQGSIEQDRDCERRLEISEASQGRRASLRAPPKLVLQVAQALDHLGVAELPKNGLVLLREAGRRFRDPAREALELSHDILIGADPFHRDRNETLSQA